MAFNLLFLMLSNPLDLSNSTKLSNMKSFLNNYKKKGIKFFLNTFNSLYLFDSKNKELSNTNDDYILLEI